MKPLKIFYRAIVAIVLATIIMLVFSISIFGLSKTKNALFKKQASAETAIPSSVIDKSSLLSKPKPAKRFTEKVASVKLVKYVPSVISARAIYKAGSMDAIAMESHKKAFILDVLPVLAKLRETMDFSIPCALGQCWHESNFGCSWLAINANQLFGIKYSKSLFDDIEKKAGKKMPYSFVSKRDDCGEKNCDFTKLESRWSSLYVYAYVINRTYAPRVKQGSGVKYERYAKALMSGKSANYATQKGYSDKIIKIIKDNDWGKLEDISYEKALSLKYETRW